MMTRMTRTILTHRRLFPDSVLLDWMELVNYLEPQTTLLTDPFNRLLIFISDLQLLWGCNDDMVRKRIRTLEEHDLIDISPVLPGDQTVWEVHRVGQSVRLKR